MLRFFYVPLLIIKYYFLFNIENKKKRPQILRSFFEEAGGSFVKFGQLLALRVDVLPKEYCLQLIDLFDHVSAFPYAEVERIFLSELGSSPKKIFDVIEETPFASGSFGQVHAAKLQDGTTVVVKVQRPDAINRLSSDFLIIDILSFIGDIFYKIEALPWKEFAHEFKTWTSLELDYLAEAVHSQRIYDNLQRRGDKDVVIPRTFHRYSTRRILVQEYVDGIPMSTILKEIKKGTLTEARLDEMGIDLKKASATMVREMMREYLFDDFFHADPHPGNILILEGSKVGIIDFGIVGESVGNKQAFAKFIYLGCANKFEESTVAFLEFAGQDLKQIIASVLPATIDQKEIDAFMEVLSVHFAKAMRSIESRVRKDLTVKKTDYSLVFLEVIKHAQRYNIRLPSEIVVFIRAITMVGFLLKEMDYDIALSGKVVRFFKQYPLESLPTSNARLQGEQRMSREVAVERLNGWLTYLIEADPKLYEVVKQYFGKYNFISA